LHSSWYLLEYHINAAQGAPGKRISMATRSLVFVHFSSTPNMDRPRVFGTYIHYDGYVAFRNSKGDVVTGVGGTLLAHYNNPSMAAAVAKMGYLSSLEDDFAKSIMGSRYLSQRPKEFASLEDLEKYLSEKYLGGDKFLPEGAEYAYLWDEGRWNIWKGGKFEPLSLEEHMMF